MTLSATSNSTQSFSTEKLGLRERGAWWSVVDRATLGRVVLHCAAAPVMFCAATVIMLAQVRARSTHCPLGLLIKAVCYSASQLSGCACRSCPETGSAPYAVLTSRHSK